MDTEKKIEPNVFFHIFEKNLGNLRGAHDANVIYLSMEHESDSTIYSIHGDKSVHKSIREVSSQVVRSEDGTKAHEGPLSESIHRSLSRLMGKISQIQHEVSSRVMEQYSEESDKNRLWIHKQTTFNSHIPNLTYTVTDISIRMMSAYREFDMLWRDSALADTLEDIGPTGADMAERIRRDSKKLLEKEKCSAESGDHEAWLYDVGLMYSRWFRLTDQQEPAFLKIIATVIWRDEFSTPSIKPASRRFAKIPKTAGSMFSWASGSKAIEIDGHKYGMMPPGSDAIVFGPQTMSMMPNCLDMTKSHQTTLPFSTNRTMVESFVGPEQLIGIPAAKCGLIVLSEPHATKSGAPIAMSVKEWAERVFPNQRFHPDHAKALATGWEQLRYVSLYGHDGAWVPMFTMRGCTEKFIKADSLLSLGLDPHCAQLLSETFYGKGHTWCGYFILDLSAALAISAKHPEQLRLHIRASVLANAAYRGKGHFDKTRLQYESLDAHAAAINTYPLEVAEALAANKRLPRSMSRAAKARSKKRTDLKKAMDRLADSKVWRVDQTGKGEHCRYRLLPTQQYEAAWADCRGARPDPY